MEAPLSPKLDLFNLIDQTEKAIKLLQKNLEALKAAEREIESYRAKERKKAEEERRTKMLSKAKSSKKWGKDLRLPKVWDVSFRGLETDVDFDNSPLVQLLDHIKAQAKGYEYEDDVIDLIDEVEQNAAEGDIIDIIGERGTGYYYVFLGDGKYRVKKTQGEYGYYLPYQALPILHKFGLETFKQVHDIWPDILGINLGKTEKEISKKGYDFIQEDVPDENTFRLKDHPNPRSD